MNSEFVKEVRGMRIIAILALLVSILGVLPIFDGGSFLFVNTIYLGVAIAQFFIALLLLFKPSFIGYLLCGCTSSYFVFFEVFYNIFSLSSIISIVVLVLILVWFYTYARLLRQDPE